MACRKSETHSTSQTPSAAGPVSLKDTALVSNLDFPWEILWGPDNYIWMTQRGGSISRVNPVTGEVSSLLSVSESRWNNEGGLLGMALHPQFETNPYVYVVYDFGADPDYKAKIVRYVYSGGNLINPTLLLDGIDAAFIHNGSRLLISSDLKLFITTGDASDTSNSQDTASLNGKVLRINLDGSIPPDNPFPGSPIWSYGHRNPQGLVMVNGKLFSSEHGPDTDDEINIIRKGSNYGWPHVK